jgi:sugar/nucleoside kinase (ribokinase family)
VDCIGAGDVFCGAFLVRYMETKDVYQSGLFASAAASISCEGRGIHSIPQRNEVIDRIRKYEMNY